jgi:hypothetical protein
MNQFVDANIKLLSLETPVFEATSLDLFSQLKDVFTKNNKDNNYIAIFQEKLNEVKPSTKFYHQTIYVSPAANEGFSSKSDEILPEDGN